MGAAFALGAFFSSRAGSKPDLAVTSFALFMASVPPLTALLVLQLFAFRTGLFPVSGMPARAAAPNVFALALMYAHHIFLLVVANIIFTFGQFQRMAKMATLDQAGQPYILALRSRGISERRVMFNHAFRNALNPLINFGVAQVIYLMGVMVMLDTIFSFRGVGLTLVNVVRSEDTNFIMIILMLTGVTISLCMLAADIMIALIDPRVRYGKG